MRWKHGHKVKPGKSSLASRKPMFQVQRKERDSGFFAWTPWWLRSPFHLHELLRAPHRPSLMLGWLSFWQITAIFMAWYPHIYGILKKETQKVKVSAIYLCHLISPPFLSLCAVLGQTSSHCGLHTRNPRSCNQCLESGNLWDEKSEQRPKVALGAMSTTWIPLEVKAATICAL